VTNFLAGIALRGAGLARSVEPRLVSEDPVTPLQALESEELERRARGLAPDAGVPVREADPQSAVPDEPADRPRQTSGLDADTTASPADLQTGPPPARPTDSSLSDEQDALPRRMHVTDVTSRPTPVTRSSAATRIAGTSRVRRRAETGERLGDPTTVVHAQAQHTVGVLWPESSIPDSTPDLGVSTPVAGIRPEATVASSVAPVVSPAPSPPIAMPLPTRQAHREEPAIEVRVGRIEIRAASPPRPAPPVARRAPRGFQERTAARRHADRRWY
jgi:hypothetical protein